MVLPTFHASATVGVSTVRTNWRFEVFFLAPVLYCAKVC